MTASRIKTLFVVLAFFALAAAGPDAHAQTSPDGRDASFMPSPPPGAATQPAAATTSASAAGATTAAATTSTTANPPPVISLPTPAATATLGAPVESGSLQNIEPDTVGLLTNEDGGLGASMWKGTPRALVDRLLPALALPTFSPALNGLAQRFLLTTAGMAGAKEKEEEGPSLVAMRAQKLVMLGDAVDAWNLASIAKPGQVDEDTLRLVAEAALITSASKDVCDKLPGIISKYTNPEWQKSLVVCQLQANDSAAAQLALEVLHAQNVKDDAFFQLAEHNIIGGAKSLPRQLTPLKPLNLALLRLIQLPLLPELYAHPPASVISALLKTKGRDDNARLALAERTGASGIIGGKELGEVYRSVTFSPEDMANPPSNIEGARWRALLYQAALNEQSPQKRLEDTEKFVQGLDSTMLKGAMAEAAVQMTGGTAASGDYAAYIVMTAKLYMLAGKPEQALGWFKTGRQASAAAPVLTIQLQDIWPLAVLSGLESDGDYGQNFASWLDYALKNADLARREQVGNLLLLFDAAGFAVPEDAWAQVADLPAGGRRTVPPSALLLERLRMAAASNHRGESVLMALTLAGSTNANESSVLAAVETVRALRLVGLTADSLAFARETAAVVLSPLAAKP